MFGGMEWLIRWLEALEIHSGWNFSSGIIGAISRWIWRTISDAWPPKLWAGLYENLEGLNREWWSSSVTTWRWGQQSNLSLGNIPNNTETCTVVWWTRHLRYTKAKSPTNIVPYLLNLQQLRLGMTDEMCPTQLERLPFIGLSEFCLTVISLTISQFKIIYHSDAKYWTIVQHLLLVFTIFEVLEGPIHGGNELETSNCNLRHSEPCKKHHSAQRHLLVQ
jgi:hypothetical protein